MSLIKQRELKTTSGTYTYTIPAGVSSIELHLWGAGGGSGSNGPATDVQVGSTSTTVQTGTQQVQTGTQQVQTGTTRVQVGTQQIQTGTVQVQVGTRRVAYQVATPSNSKGSVSNNGKGGSTSYTTAYRDEPIYETRPVFTTVPVYADQPVFGTQPVYSTQPVISTITNPILETRSGGPGGTGGGGGYASKKLQVVKGDILEISVGGAGSGGVGGFGLQISQGTAKPLVELPMPDENWIDPFKSAAGTSNDICVAVIDEVSPSQSEINASWTAFRTQWPTRKIYLLQPKRNNDEVKIPAGFTSDPNAFGPIIVNRDNGNNSVASKWYDLINADSLVSGASIRLAVDDSGSMRGDVPNSSANRNCVTASIALFKSDLNTSNGVNYRGGNSGTSSSGGRGGGGGGATVARLNGNIVLVAAGGGGGGGGGVQGAAGGSGNPAVDSGIGSGDQGQGKFSSSGTASGGAGGGGWYSGIAGASGATGSGGTGGVSYGSQILPGSGSLPGGRTLSVYPGNNAGAAGFAGAALINFVKSFNIRVKVNNDWKFVDRGWVKVNGEWKELLNGWTKVSGQWYPFVTNRSVEGAENPVAPTITYSLAANRSSVSEGNAVSFTVTTTGLANGTQLPYTATGVQSSELVVGSLTGSFVVGTSPTITFVPRQDSTTNGNRVLKVAIHNTDAAASTIILDTSVSPTYGLSSNVGTINEGQAVRFTMSSANAPSGETISYTVSGISASRLQPGSSPLQGTFTVGGSVTADFGVTQNSFTDGASAITMNLVGKGKSATVTVIDSSITPSGNETFTSTAYWTVPAGVSSISVVMVGAGGAGGDGAGVDGVPDGGSAGTVVSTTLTVTPGEQLAMVVGAGGARVKYNSGDRGGDGTASQIRRGNAVLVTAAGGTGGKRANGSSSSGRSSGAPFNGAGGAGSWGGPDAGNGGVGAGGGGIDGKASGYFSGNGGRGEIRISWG